MPSTADFQRMINQARRRPAGSRQTPILEHKGKPCPECGNEPCTCDECMEESQLVGRLPRESLETMEILAATDPRSFTFLAECDGLRVSSHRQYDPLSNEATAEDVEVVVDSITENPDALDDYQQEVRKIGQEYGFIIRA